MESPPIKYKFAQIVLNRGPEVCQGGQKARWSHGDSTVAVLDRRAHAGGADVLAIPGVGETAKRW